MRLTLVTGPTIEPLTVAEVRARSNIGSKSSDEVVQAYITAARQTIDGADGWLGRALNTQTWRGGLDEFPTCDGGRIYIPLPPLQSITEISYLDAHGLPVAVAGGGYQLVMGPRPYIVPIALNCSTRPWLCDICKRVIGAKNGHKRSGCSGRSM